MNNKVLNLNDIISSKDDMTIHTSSLPSFIHSNIKTKVTAVCTDTGEVLWTTHNKTTLAGSSFLARALFDINEPEKTPSYNSMLGLYESNNPEDFTKEKVCLFCVGTDGCGVINSSIYAAKVASWINPDYTDDYGGIVPFRYVTKDAVGTIITGDPSLTGSYYGKKENLGQNADRVGFYFKRFDSNITFTQQFTDGTPIGSDVYTVAETTDSDVETIVNLQMSITKDDCRDFFLYGSGINDARINSLSLCVGEYDSSKKEYVNIRPVTRLNFSNELTIMMAPCYGDIA